MSSTEPPATSCTTEPKIVEAIGPPKLFVEDIVRFADEAAERLRRDHEAFREDREMEAFRILDVVYQ